jgi:hypothetical protein
MPETEQGPVPRQVQDIMRVLEDPRQVLKEAGITRKDLLAMANGQSSKETRDALGPVRRARGAGGGRAPVGAGQIPRVLHEWLEQR